MGTTTEAVYRVAIDIGGTFTDFVVQEASTGVTRTGKLLSTPGDLANAVIEGLDRFVPPASEVDFLVHGTTAGLNALIERRGARVLLVATEGFRDIYTIAGNDRREIFNVRYRKPEPLVPQELAVEVRERLAADGSVVTALEPGSLEAAVQLARAQEVEAVAVCLLFSYLNPAHELAVERYLEEHLPGAQVTCSHRVSREWREYARASSAIMNAYIAPTVTRYLTTLVGSLEADRASKLLVMQSNGGVMTAAAARQMPLQTLLSGPVGGTIGAQQIARDLGRDNLICVDMGGTSFDGSLVVGNTASVSNEAEVEGLPVQMPVVDIYGVGAGGGSVGWTEAGAMRVGPRSAGADPGPACYGRGGAEPTVTDANLLLGRIGEARFAGGGMSLDTEAARKAIARLGEQIGMDVLETAQGIVDVVNAKMADAISTVTVRRGIDPRGFALVAFGGAGPMHAADLAARLDIAEVIVPMLPGTFSAWGMLQTDFRHDLRSTLYRDLSQADPAEIGASYRQLEAEGASFLADEGIVPAAMAFERTADLRYAGQEYALTVTLGPPGEVDIAALRERFDRLYLERYGHSNPVAPAELVKLGVIATGKVPRPVPGAPAAEPRTAWGQRKAFFCGRAHDCTIATREQLAAGEQLKGPVIIEEATSTTVVPPGWWARV
ncbi:MAG: hydantoinase/oxoprolinase family protein, partial [Acidimicrobiales bacterium]